MSFLSKLQYNEEIQQEKDTLGGFSLFESNIYEAVIKYAYLSETINGAGMLNFEFDIDGKTYNEALCVVGKNGSNIWKKDGKSGYLPSFLTADAISLFASNKSLSELKETTKEIELYDKEAGKKLPTKVPMLMDLVGKTVKLGIIKEKVFKQEKNANGNYVDTAETRETNKIDKVFSAKDNRTVPEVRAEMSEAGFYKDWLSKYENQIVDKTQGKTPANSLDVSKPKKSLFAS